LKFKLRQKDQQGLVIMEPRPDFADVWHVQPARTICQVKNGTIVGKILNPNNDTMILVPGTVVGYIDFVDQIVDPSQSSQEPVAHLYFSNMNVENAQEQVKELGIDLTDADLLEEQKQQMAAFLLSHRDIFATNMSELGVTHLQEMTIDTGINPPVKQRPYRVAPHMKDEIDRQVEEMLENHIIRPSISPYASPVVMVKKKSGDYRFAIDYRRLNDITTTINYPLPRFEDVTDIIGNASMFSVMDLMSGFWQIPVAEESKPKTAFICHSGLYEFERVPFGLKNSPVVFQNVMESALRGLHYKTALVYVDDIIAFSKDFETHLQNLAEIFDHLRAANLRLKPSKCHFAVKEVVYLGHVISKQGVSPDPAKVKLVKEFPVPQTQRDVRAFLGLANYYRKFVKNFSAIATPLNKLLSKDTPFQWTDECQKAFDILKHALTEAPILVYPNFDKQFILYTDASSTAISYILGQLDDEGRERVISYSGRGLKPTEKRWSISERECLAVVEGIKTFKVYLANKKFLVKTDHSAIQFLKKVKDPTGRLGRWMIFLQSYDFDVEYKPGKVHGNADSLSRRRYPDTPEGQEEDEVGELPFLYKCTLSPATESFSQENIDNIQWSTERDYFVNTLEPSMIRSLQRKDAQLKQMIDYLENSTLPEDSKVARRLALDAQDHILDDDILYHLWYPRGTGTRSDRVIKQLVVPVSLRNEVLLSFHDSLIAGAHQGVDRTYQNIRLRYFWPNMYADVTDYVKSCLDCQQSKRYYGAAKPPLCPLPIPTLFQRLHIDFLGPLETTPEGYKYILLIVDAYSKWPEAFPLASTDATEVAWVLYREIFCRYGAPDMLLSDRGQNFMSKLITELCAIFQVTRLRTSSYHAQTNAQCERFNSFLASSLRTLCGKGTNDWAKKIPAILSAYRVTPCTQSTQFSPYFLLFKKECRLPLDVTLIPPNNLSATANQCMQDILQGFQTTQTIVKENIVKAQGKYKHYYDRNAQPHKFVVGQRVWLYTPKVKVGASTKLFRKWSGPYYICAELSGNVFILRRSSDNKQLKSPVNSVRLKPFFDPKDRPTNILPDLDISDNEAEEENEIVMDDESKNEHVNDSDSSPISQSLPVPDDNAQSEEEEIYEVERILASRTQNGVKQYKIKWKGFPTPTWEPKDNIPDELLQQFHIRRTTTGRRRKRRR